MGGRLVHIFHIPLIQIAISPLWVLRRMLPSLLLWTALLASLPPAQAQPYPAYDLDVYVETAGHVITGLMTVRLPEGAVRPAGGWWFHLPPNRYAEEDPRGVAEILGPARVGFKFSRSDPIDHNFPDGFDSGNIEILAVQDEAGRPLDFTFAPNPGQPLGHWREDTLMRVAFHPASSRRFVTIQFVTRLPNRYLEGWSDAGIMAGQWHPVLLSHRGGPWEKDVFAPAGGNYALRIQVDGSGWLAAGSALPEPVVPGTVLKFAGGGPQRVYPLLFVPELRAMKRDVLGTRLQVFFGEDHERVAQLALDVGDKFLRFMKERYGLSSPRPAISLLQSGITQSEIVTAGDTIIIPEFYFKNNPLLDRVFVGKLARALAEVWFGNAVWANRDTQAWLHLGLTGYVSLDFFRQLYGWDASIHDLVDWLSPKYREHFFEAKVIERIRNERDVPVMVSLHGHPERAATAVSVFQKAPLVIRSLGYLVGERKFVAALARFYREYRGRPATLADFRRVVEEVSGQSLGWYFDSWFHGTPRMDYALGDWSAEPVAGGYRVRVQLLRLEETVMPVELQVVMEGGGEMIRRWDGVADQTTLEFTVPAPVERLVVDPREFLLETERQNNQSFTSIRWRPFYDWSKQRESLVTVITRIGGNAIDGNVIGVGAKIKFNEDHNLSMLPIFAENTSELLYSVSYEVSRLFNPRLTYLLAGSKLGGQETLSTGFRYQHDLPERLDFDTTYLLRVERVNAASLGGGTNDPIQQPGNVNNISIIHEERYSPGLPHESGLAVALEHSQPAFDSEFRYTTLLASFAQNLDLHANHRFRFELIRGLTDGDAPIQKQHLLGDPLVMRGFPRTVGLVSDNIAVLRSEYQLVLTRGVVGSSLQTRKLTLILFADIGKGWDNDEDFDQALTRKDVGFGFEIDLIAMNLLQFPIRVEVAFPVDDPQFKNSQVIFFQALTFF